MFKRPIQTVCFLWPPDSETIERDTGNIQKYLQDFSWRCFTPLSSGQTALPGPGLSSSLNWMVSVGPSQPIWFCISSIGVLYGEAASLIFRRGLFQSFQHLFFQTFLLFLEIHPCDGGSYKLLSTKNDSAAECEILAKK